MRAAHTALIHGNLSLMKLQSETEAKNERLGLFLSPAMQLQMPSFLLAIIITPHTTFLLAVFFIWDKLQNLKPFQAQHYTVGFICATSLRYWQKKTRGQVKSTDVALLKSNF